MSYEVDSDRTMERQLTRARRDPRKRVTFSSDDDEGYEVDMLDPKKQGSKATKAGPSQRKQKAGRAADVRSKVTGGGSTNERGGGPVGGDSADEEEERFDLSAPGSQALSAGKQKSREKDGDGRKGQNAGRKSAKESQPDDDGDDSPDEENEASAPTKIRCEISIGTAASDLESWSTPLTWLLPSTTTVTDFNQMVRVRLTKVLEADDVLLEECLDDNRLLCYYIHFLVACCGEEDHQPTQSRHKFDTLGDLFEDLSAVGLKLEVLVQVTCEDRPEDVKDQPPYRFNVGESDQTPALNLVVEGQDLNEETDRWSWSHTRLGNAGKRKASVKDGVPARTMLLGEWFTGLMKQTDDLFIIAVKGWDFGDFCIGDVHICDKHDYKANDDYFKPYHGVGYVATLKNTIRKRVGSEEPEPGSGVPFMPTYTLNHLDSKALGLGYRLQEGEEIDGIVRFVDHIGHRSYREDGPRASLQPRWLPYDRRHHFDREDKIRSVIKCILEDLKCCADKWEASDRRETMRKLMARNDWKLQMWVLPQKGRKMYRFPNDHAQNWASLQEYLDEEKVKKGGRFARALYMEAHIVLRDGSEDDFVATSVGDGEEEEEDDTKNSGAAGKEKKGKPGKRAAKGTAGSNGDGEEEVEGKKKAGGRK